MSESHPTHDDDAQRAPERGPIHITEGERLYEFPVVRERIYFGHAGVCPLPKCAADAIVDYTRLASEQTQEFAETLRDIKKARQTCAEFIGAKPQEIALLGPTSLGLSLFANGIPWQPGDEVLCYAGDYPANVYPWIDLRRRGVVVRYLEPEQPGEITPELVAAALTPRTRLVALASCHFFTGYRIAIDAIGAMLHAHGVLFSVDGIQTLGAFPLSVEHVDFLSADAHKWMLGPVSIGIVYVKQQHFDLVRPTLLGAWNVVSPNFIARDEVEFVPTAQRYEPGVLNIGPIYGMCASIRMLMEFGLDRVAARILALKAYLVGKLRELGFEFLGPVEEPAATGITTFRHPRASSAALFAALEAAKITASLRHSREGVEYLRFSPHFYNTETEIDRAVEVLAQGVAQS